MLKKLALMAIAMILTIASLNTDANAFLYNNGTNQCIATVINTTGTEPDGYCKTYSVTTGDDLTYSIILTNLVNPDRLTIKMPDGLDFNAITTSRVFGTSSFKEYNWNVKTHIKQTENPVQINLSDLPENTNRVTIQFTCTANQNISQYGTAPEIILTDKNQNDYPVNTRKVHGLAIRIKTIDSKLKPSENKLDTYANQYLSNSQFILYKNADLTEPVIFEKQGASYIATKIPSDTTSKILDDATGMLMLKNLHEGTYYLKQTQAPKNYNLIPSPIEIKIAGEYKFDPNDPSNKDDDESKLVLVNPFKNFDKTDSEKRKESVLKEKQRKENLKLAAEYHATHPKEIISNVQILSATQNITSENTDQNADVILNYNAPINMQHMLIKIAIFTACFGIGGYCVRKIFNGRTKSRSGKTEKS